jgi:hypothetical protein
MTQEQQLLFKSYFYSGIGFDTYSYGSIVSILYLDENELILQTPDDKLWSGRDTKVVQLDKFFFEIKRAKHNGLDNRQVIQQLNATQRASAKRIHELQSQINFYQDHQYKSAAEKKKFIGMFKKSITVFEYVIKECDQAKKFMSTRN